MRCAQPVTRFVYPTVTVALAQPLYHKTNLLAVYSRTSATIEMEEQERKLFAQFTRSPKSPSLNMTLPEMRQQLHGVWRVVRVVVTSQWAYLFRFGAITIPRRSALAISSQLSRPCRCRNCALVVNGVKGMRACMRSFVRIKTISLNVLSRSTFCNIPFIVIITTRWC